VAQRSGSGTAGPGGSGAHPEERLAPVRYLFGAPASQPRGVTDSEGWYVDPEAAPVADAPVADVAAASAVADSAAADRAAATAADALAVAYAELAEAQAAAARVGTAKAEADRERGAVTFSRVHKTAAEIAAADPETFSLTPTPRITFVAESEDADDGDDGPKRSRVTEVSLNALARKGMSSAEMTRLLASREVDPEEADEHVARLEAAGLLDDRALAENLVRSLRERKGLGRSAISAELRRRQVDEAAVIEALDAIDTDDELTQACEVAAKRAAQLSSYDPATAKRRLGAYLQRRGYSGSVLSTAMSRALDGPASGPRFR
jgi:regulatory protein